MRFIFSLTLMLAAFTVHAEDNAIQQVPTQNVKCHCGCPAPCHCGCTEGHECHCPR